MEIFIRPITKDDTNNIVKWRNAPAVREMLFSRDEITEEIHDNYFRNMIETGKCHQFVISIYNGLEKKDVGTTFLKNIDSDNRSAEFGIFIGDAENRGLGVGQEATKKVLRYAFEQLNLNKVWLTVFADNRRAVDCYEKVGFVKCAYYRQEILRNGCFFDVVGMELLRSEWEG